MKKAFVAKRYDVVWEVTNIKSEDLEKMIDELNNNEMEDVVGGNGEWYEFEKEGLEVAINTKNISDETKKIAKYFLEISDVNNSYVRVEMG